MMSKIHQSTKMVAAILFILILAFVGLMVFEWGADMSGSSYLNANAVGSVNGEDISWEAFSRLVSQAKTNQEQQSGSNLDEEQTTRLRNQLWDQLVQRMILKDEIDKLDIVVTDEDIATQVLQIVARQQAQNPQFQTNGQVDLDKVRAALNDDQNPQLRSTLLYMEEQISEDLPYQKLDQIMSASVVVTEQEMRDAFMAKNVEAKIEYLLSPASAYRDADVEATDAEIEAYYQANKDDFKANETRKLKYAFFSTAPSAEDSSRFFRIMNEIKSEMSAEDADLNSIARRESEDPSAQENGGDLGYFESGAMVKPFSDAAFAANIGDVIGPVKTQFGYHVIKVLDKKVEDGKDKVRAVHVLKELVTGGDTYEIARSSADELGAAAKKVGLDIAADNNGVTLKETAAIAQNDQGIIPGLGTLQTAMVWAFSAEKDDVSEVFYNNTGYYVIKVEDVSPAGFRSLEDVKNVCKSRVETQKRKDMAKAYAESIASQINNSSDFNALAANDNKLLADTTDFFGYSVTVAKIGRAPNVVAKAFSMALNETSGILETDRGYYFIRVTDRKDFDETAYEAQRTTLRNQLVAQKSRSLFREWVAKLKDKSEIEDLRYKFFRS